MLQLYFLRQAFVPLVASVAALGVLALLTQSMATLDIIIDQRQSLFTYLEITVLALPQLISLVLPLAMFVTALYAISRLKNDSEVVVCAAAGMGRWQTAAPIFKLAVAAMIANLAVNLWVQPASFRYMRERIYEVRGDLAPTLIRPGQFTSPVNGLTIYSRDVERGGVVTDILIEDARAPEQPVTYMAQHGVFGDIGGEAALVLHNGSIHTVEEDHSLSYLQFDSYPFVLSDFLERPADLFYKLSDRYLHELLFPNPNNLWDWRHRGALLAEGHYRLSATLYNPALVLIALAGVLGGEFSRVGNNRTIVIAAAAAIATRLIGFAVQAASADAPGLNPLQYAVPLIAGAIALMFLVSPSQRTRLRQRRIAS